jgi:phenylacetyl-CoA:acceptor oxidoreductase
MKRKGIRYELPYQERIKRIGEELGARLHEKGIYWWDSQVEEYQALIHWQDSNKFLDAIAIKLGKNPEDYPFWLVTTHSMQYAWSSNVAIPIMMEASNRMMGGNWAQMNCKTAESLGIKEGDEVWLESAYAKTKGRVTLREGIRPDCIVTVGSFGQWATPYAKDFAIPNINDVAPAFIETTDEGGASKNHAKVKVYKA